LVIITLSFTVFKLRKRWMRNSSDNQAPVSIIPMNNVAGFQNHAIDVNGDNGGIALIPSHQHSCLKLTKTIKSANSNETDGSTASSFKLVTTESCV
jgi:hypothetical protein